MPEIDSLPNVASQPALHPYLSREQRLIALTRALRPLSDAALDEPGARAAAYAAARLDPPIGGEDEEALRRARRYWRRVKPSLVVALTDFASARVLDRFAPNGLPNDLPTRVYPGVLGHA